MKAQRRHMLRLLGVCLAAPIAAAAWSPDAQAQSNYPSQPINMIVSYGPGGGTDLVARMMTPYLQKYLGDGAKVVVLNRPGAGGGIGFGELARAQPDGYTIGFINTPNLLTIPIERKSTFNWKSYDLLGNLIDDPGGFAVHTDSKIKTLAELADEARKNPGKVTVGTTGTGSDDHVAMLRFQRSSGTELSHIPYKGAGEVRSALQGREIVIGAINIGEALQYQKGGTPLRILGQMSAKRSPLLPDVPTFKEQGFDFELASLRGLAAPKGLPSDVRQKLVEAIKKTYDDPEFKEKAAALFAPLRYLDPTAYAQELQTSEQGFEALWKELPWIEK